MVSRSAYKKLKIDVVDELHSIRKDLAKTTEHEIHQEAGEVRKSIAKLKSKKVK